MTKYLSHAEVVNGSTQSPAIRDIKPALAMLEFHSIALGMLAADAMVKQAPVELIHAGTVQPGRYLVLVGGPVAEVEEALTAGREAGADTLSDTVWLPGVHPAVLAVIHPAHHPPPSLQCPATSDALGIIETATAPAAIQSGDVAVKGADIKLLSIRFADGLGGKGIVLAVGAVSDVEAALELVKSALKAEVLIRTVIISQLHDDMVRNVFGATRFFR